MSTGKEQHIEQLSRITKYYDKAQKFYHYMWYQGALGLHYGFWDSDVENRAQAILKENEILADMAGIGQDDLVLDAGCGVGGSGIWLAQEKGAKVVELNIVDKQLRIGQKLVRQNSRMGKIFFSRADYHFLPFVDNCFNCFWSLESIEHSDDLGLFTSEAHRVLRTEGTAIIAGTFMGSTRPSVLQEHQLDVGFRAAGAFNDFRSAHDVARLMESAGFVNIQVHNVNDLVMESAKQMEQMCNLGLPLAKLGNKMGVISQIMVDNTEWGTYQKSLFESGVTSYDIIVAQKK